MLIDEDSYNLDPVHFHYCFLQLINYKKYSLIKKNFKSNLLKNLLEKIDLDDKKEIKSLYFTVERSSDEGSEMYFEFEDRRCSEVMYSYAKNKI